MGKHNDDERPTGLTLINPFSGEVFGSDLDSLIRAYRQTLEQQKELREFACTLSRLIASYSTEAPPDPIFTRTTRLAGSTERVRLLWAAPRFDQRALVQIWTDWPRQSRDVLKIGRLAVALRQFKKIVKCEGGTSLYRRFREQLLASQVQMELIPRVAIDVCVPKKPGTEGSSELEFHDRSDDEDDDLQEQEESA